MHVVTRDSSGTREITFRPRLLDNNIYYINYKGSIMVWYGDIVVVTTSSVTTHIAVSTTNKRY